MNWVLVAAVSIAIYAYTRWKLSKLPQIGPQKWQRPTAEEGTPIAVVFGEADINPNILMFQDASSEEQALIEPTGLRYNAAIEFGLCHGCIDGVTRIVVGGKDVYVSGRLLEPGTFDGSTVPVVGVQYTDPTDGDDVHFNFDLNRGLIKSAVADGTPTRQADKYVAGIFSLSKIWGNNGVAALRPWSQGCVGNGAYLKPWSIRVQRLWRTRAGTAAQWYPEKAAIIIGRNIEDVWKYWLQSATDSTDCSAAAYNDSGWSEGPGGFGNELPGRPGQGMNVAGDWTSRVPEVRTCVADGFNAFTWVAGNPATPPTVVNGTKLWVRGDLGALPNADLAVRVWHDDTAQLWFNGNAVTLTPVYDKNDAVSSSYNSYALIPKGLISPLGSNVIALKVTDTGGGKTKYIYAGMQVGLDRQSPYGVVNMNPIHIVRELLQDPYFGDIGVSDADIDDASFEAAADTLYNERLGMSLVWSEAQKTEDLIAEVMRHIDGNLVVDRVTGKYKIKLLRADYVVGDLLTIDYTNARAVKNAKRKTVAELTNAVTVTYKRAPYGDKGSVTLHDSGLQDEQGGVVPATLNYSGFTDAYAANVVALRNLKLLSSSLLVCDIEDVSREAEGLDCGDAFILNFPIDKIYNVVMRVTDINFGDGRRAAIKITAMQDVYSAPGLAVVNTAPIGFPPQVLGPLPGTTEAVRFYCCKKRDPLNRGTCVGAFVGYYGCGGGDTAPWNGWTEGPAGTWTRDTTGVPPSVSFDGITLSAGMLADTQKRSPYEGQTFMAFRTSSAGDYVNTGPFKLIDAGAYYDDSEPPQWVETNAVMRRDPDYDATADFVPGMAFQMEEGDDYGTKYIRLDKSPIVLGTDQMIWSAHDVIVFDDDEGLLTVDEFALGRLEGGPITVSRTLASGQADFDADFSSRVLERATIAAGPWKGIFAEVWLTADDPAATTTVGWKVLRYNGSGATLFEVQSEAIHNTSPEPKSFSYDGPEFALEEGDWLVLVPVAHTTAASPITINIRYDGLAKSSWLSAPFDIFKDTLTRHVYGVNPRKLAPGFDGDVITLDTCTGFATVTLAAGSNVLGIASPGPKAGDILNLVVNGATPESPITFVHGSTDIPASADALFVSSAGNLGTEYENLQIYATRTLLSFIFTDDGDWQLMPGGGLS